MSNVHAVIVTYHPDIDVVSCNISQLLGNDSLSAIHIVDNTPEATALSSLMSERVTLHLLGDNKGIAYAQNIGIKLALNANADYIILFDQDSELKAELISELLSAMQEAKVADIKLACVGPRPLDVFSGQKYTPTVQREEKVNRNLTLCSQIIASGKLIDVDALHVIGLMDESLFIDGVDHEWCWRARKYGYQVAIAENAVMEHKLGDARGCFLGVSYKIGSAIRMYYQFRNILILARRGYVPLYWKLRNIIGMFFRFIVFSFGHVDSSRRRKYMFHGVRDGIIKRMGAYLER